MHVTRRTLLAAAARAGAVAGTSRLLGPGLLAQAGPTAAAGKEKLLVRSIRPTDYEAPVAQLDSWITPIDSFYVRSHLAAPPPADPAAWRVELEGQIASPAALSLDDIRRLPAVTITATLECAGNGRAFFQPPVPGVQWAKGAVGTARWTGVRMKDVLARAGLKPAGRFVVMEGADRPFGAMPDFVRQIPVEKALDPDTIVAYEMNGEALPTLHGGPLRMIVPGWEGAYWMKWLTGLRILDQPFDGFWVATAYRYPTRRVAPGAAVDPRDMAPLSGLAVKSLITRPLDGATLPAGRVEVAGFAWAGEHDVTAVDVSTDGGAAWTPARLTGEKARFTWQRFEFSFDATVPQSYLIMTRATDSSGRVQPIVPQWNPSGYLWNAPDNVRVDVR